jgi:hypothetical protein
MSYKPTHEDLVAYLYGESDESVKAQIEIYLKEHPEARKELEELEEARVVLGQWEDEEVPQLPGFIQPYENSEWLYWRKYVGIAASILLIVTVGWLTRFNISYDDQGFRAGFTATNNGLSIEEVDALLAKERENILSELDNQLGVLQADINDNKSSIDSNLERINLQPQDDLNRLNEQKEQILAKMNQLSNELTEGYRNVFKELVVSFSNNYETQRIKDLSNVQAAFNDLEDAISSKQEVLEEALYNLSVEVDALAPNNNNN